MLKKYVKYGVVFLVCVLMLGIIGYTDTHDTRQGYVVSINDNDDVVIEDTTGNVWSINKSGYEIGQKVIMKMCNNGTIDNVTDDTITNIKIAAT